MEKFRAYVASKSSGILVKKIVLYYRSSRVEFLVGTSLSLNLSNKVRSLEQKTSAFLHKHFRKKGK